MNVKHLAVQRFRGIRNLDWAPGGTTIYLIGPGDSTKTTILDALEWVLSPRWSLPISDADFYEASTEEPIVIEATIGELTGSLMSDQKFGLQLRGWGADGLHDEPDEGDEPVLTIRLTIDDTLEPRWEVVNDREPEPRPISARDRESLGVARLGPEVERHLTWGRGSALLRLTDSTEEMGRTLATAHRSARDMVNSAELAELKAAAERASEKAIELGAGAAQIYVPAMDPDSISVGTGALGLHEGRVPVRASGLGSRRLAALAVQRASVPQGAIVLVDEIETGLEPHRLRHLIRVLRTAENGQVLVTTHSEIAIVELTAGELRVVIKENGTTRVGEVPDELQGAVRAAPEALLGRRVIVAEGPTEVGLCRALDPVWSQARGVPPAHIGVVVVPGNGSQAPGRAQALATLGYRTALLADSDVPLSPSETELSRCGVTVLTWDGGVSSEERVMLDLPWDVLITVLDRASQLMDDNVPHAAADAVAADLGAERGDPESWLRTGFVEEEIRRAMGRSAKRLGWFKRTDLGEVLGRIVMEALPRMQESDLATRLRALGDWAYG